MDQMKMSIPTYPREIDVHFDFDFRVRDRGNLDNWDFNIYSIKDTETGEEIFHNMGKDDMFHIYENIFWDYNNDHYDF